MTKGRLLLWSITSALAGFLFGFDTVVISGAEKEIQDLWALSGTMHGWALSSALWGTVLGACFGGIPTKRWGRRKILIFNGILYVVSAIGSGLAWDVGSFIVARFIGGVGIGISTIAAPLFIAEISPAKDRGKLGGLFQFNIVFGILVAYLSNYIIGNLCDIGVGWRWMLGVEAVPAVIYTLMCFSLPESPRWLIVDANRPEEGVEVFRKINPGMSEAEIAELAGSVEATRVPAGKHSKFWTMRMRKPIFFAFLIAFFNQVSGINVILYFAPRLLGLAGMNNALAASISLGVTNLIFTFVGLWLIDRLGRRTLLYIGSAGYILSLGICATAFFSFSEFKVVSASIDTITGAEQVMRIERGEGYFSAADKQRAAADYAAARKALGRRCRIGTVQGGENPPSRAAPAGRGESGGRTLENRSFEASRRLELHRARLHDRLHRGPRRRVRNDYLGIHLGDLPERPARGRTGARQLHALDFRGAADAGLPDRDQGVRHGLHVRLFLRDDDPAADLGENHDAGDEGAVARADRKAARPGERSVNAGGRTVFRASGHSGSGNAAHRWRSRSTQPFGLKRTPSRSSNARCSGQPGAVRPAWFTTRWHGSLRPAGTRETARPTMRERRGWPVRNAICP